MTGEPAPGAPTFGDRLRAARRAIAALPPLAILGAGWALFVIYAYPGLMTYDSFSQLDEARAGVYRDINPPVVQLVWAGLDRVVAGPFGMLVVQSTALLAGAYLIARRLVGPRAAAVCACALLLLPPVLAVMAVIWTHSLLAGLALLGAGLALSPSRRVRIAGVAVLALAAATRYNAAAATLPLIALAFDPATARWRRRALIAALWAATALAAYAANRALTDRETAFWHASLAVMDITGTVRFAGELPDDELREILAGTPLVVERDIQAYARAHYARAGWRGLAGDARLFDIPPADVTALPGPQQAAIAGAWRALVTAHPGAYLRHRAACFAAVLGLTEEEWSRKLIVTHDYQQQDRLLAAEVQRSYSRLAAAWGRGVDALAATPLFRPWLYLALAIALAIKLRRSRRLLLVLASGLAAEASLFVYARDPDFRNSHWLVCCACFAAIVAIARAIRRAPRDQSATPVTQASPPAT